MIDGKNYQSFCDKTSLTAVRMHRSRALLIFLRLTGLALLGRSSDRGTVNSDSLFGAVEDVGLVPVFRIYVFGSRTPQFQDDQYAALSPTVVYSFRSGA
jgi:hypothetical protein